MSASESESVAVESSTRRPSRALHWGLMGAVIALGLTAFALSGGPSFGVLVVPPGEPTISWSPLASAGVLVVVIVGLAAGLVAVGAGANGGDD